MPGPGFLFLWVAIKGPVTFIYSLPSPNPTPFFEDLLNSDSIWYIFGGGHFGTLS